MVQFLSGAQAEGGVKHWVMHGVPHNPMGLWVKTLARDPTVNVTAVTGFRDLSNMDIGKRVFTQPTNVCHLSTY